MKLRTLTRVAGLALCVVAFSGTAAANGGGGGGETSKATPPGQEMKAEKAQTAASSESPSQGKAAAQADVKASAKAQANASTTAQSKASAKAQSKVSANAQSKASAKAQSKASAKAQSKAQPKPSQKAQQAAKPQTQSQGRSAEAHHHVIICHRTGSDSNPYVVINIPWTAWTEAHSPDTGSHPDLNGRHDILLKDPASRPGSKDGFTKANCPAAAPAQQPQAEQKQQPTDVCPNVEGMQTSVPSGQVKDAQGNCVAPTVVATAQTAPAGEVKGAVSPSVKASAKAAAKASAPAQAQPASGVLGATASAPEAIEETGESGTLPFTGVPVWFVALLGAGLLLTGLALRRSTQH